MKNHEQISEMLAGFALGELSQGQRSAVEAHLAECGRCREQLKRLELLLESAGKMSELRADEGLCESARESVLSAIAKEGDAQSASRDSGGVIVWRKVFESRSARLAAAAAVIVVVVLIGIKVLGGGSEERREMIVKPYTPEKGDVIEDVKDERDVLEEELKIIERMAFDGDVDGLVAMLYEGESESKTMAANYLATLGDMGTIEALEKLSGQWQGDQEDNPFVSAIEVIKERLEREKSEAGTGTTGKAESQMTAKGADAVIRPLLSGVITDADSGEGVVGATVVINKASYYRAVTDANGYYRFDKVGRDGEYRIRIASNEYYWHGDMQGNAEVYLSKDGSAVQNFALKRGCEIAIDVVDEQGEGVKKASVYVAWMGKRFGRWVDRGQRAVRTDEYGQVTLGAYEPSKIAYLITVRHTDYAPGKLIANLSDPNVIEYGEIVMRKGVKVDGYATYSDGAPASGLKIQAKPAWWNISSNPRPVPIDPNGYFTLEHINPEMYTISIYKSRSGGGGSSYVVMETNLPPADGLLVVKAKEVSPGGRDPRSTKIESAVEEQAEVSLSGRVSFIGEGEAGEVEVKVSSAASGSRTARLAEGKFAIDSLKPGFHRVSFRGKNIENQTLWNVAAPSSGLEVELRIGGKPQLKGSVVAADTGEPVRKFKARGKVLTIRRGTWGGSLRDRWEHFGDGKFDIEAERPGVYQVQVMAEGYAPLWSGEIDTDEDGEVTVELSRGGTIKGKVVNEEGESISGAKVVALSAACGNASFNEKVFATETRAVESAGGVFVLENVAEGTETLKVTHPGYSRAVLGEIAVVGGRVAEVEIVLSRGGMVEGYVCDAAGKGQANVLLSFQDAANYRGSREVGRLGSVVTDANGFYRLGGLPEGLCHVQQSEWHRRGGVVRRTVAVVAGKTVRLDFGGAAVVSGRILVDGEALANTKLLLSDAYNSRSLDFVCYGTSSSNGQFEFRGIPEGIYGIYYKLPQSRQHTGDDWAKAVTIDVAEQESDFGIVDVTTGTVIVRTNFAEHDAIFDGADVYFQRGKQQWGTRMGSVSEPGSEGEPYTVTGLADGTYSFVVKRADMVQFMEIFEFEAQSEQVEVSLEIPTCTSAVRGRLASHPDNMRLVIRREDRKVIGVIGPIGDGTYKVDHLPAGDYSIGGHYTITNAPLVRFRLAEGEIKTVDVDPSGLSWVNKGALRTQIVDEKRQPLGAAKVWLEGSGDRLEPFDVTEDGQFFVSEPGDYVLRVTCPGYEAARKDVYLEGQDLLATGVYGPTTIVELKKD